MYKMLVSENSFVRAAGMLIYRRRKTSPIIEYLLLQASCKPFHWTPPKGHVDPGEDDFTAAVRETHEEAGIDPVAQLYVDPSFRYEQRYTIKSSSRYAEEVERQKLITYWLASPKAGMDLDVKLSDEHKEFCWVTLDEALKLVGYSEMKEMFKTAEEHLQNKNKI